MTDTLRFYLDENVSNDIVYFKQQTRSVKQILQGLFVLHATLTPQEMQKRIEYL